ncbi:MAG: SUMF1/EgtB/PvdO family nonheme iron enzyme [Planctomycetota bacterium]|jgi:formylglycine-generating enzyme required for sulfatase activity
MDRGRRTFGLPVVLLALVPTLGTAERASGGDAMGQVRRINPDAFQRAFADLCKRYPEYAKKARAWKADVARIGGMKSAVERSGNRAEAEKLLAFQRKVLVDNHPAVGFEKLLFIKRRGNIGLTANWQGNDRLDKGKFDNEVMTLDIKDPGAEPKTVFRPPNSSYIGEIDLHWDAKKMIFSTNGRVCEVGLDGRGFRAVIPNLNGYDPCYLPDERILFVSNSAWHAVPCVGGADYVGNIYIAKRDGRGIRRLCYDQDNNWHPTVLDNGRVLFARWEYTDSAHYFSRILMHMNPDGTNQVEFYGSNSYWPNSLFYARAIPGSTTKFVAVVSGHHGVRRMGELVLFDASKGRHEADGAVQRIPGWGKKVEAITRDKLVDGSWPRFLMPFPLDESGFLVSCQTSSNASWNIYYVDVFDNMLLIKEIQGAHCLEPYPLKARKRPRVVPDRVRPTAKTASVYIANIYEGRGLPGVPKGVVKGLRVLQYEYAYRHTGGHNQIGYEGPWDVRRLLGTVPVGKDGSATFSIPANVPVALQPLDEQGRALAQMRSWLVGMPGENISCVGCHENQNATAKSTPSSAARRRPARLKPWYGRTRGFSFQREVQPVLDRYCVGCHDKVDGKKPCFVDDGKPIGFPTAQSRYSRPYLDLARFVRRNGPEGDYHSLTPLEFHVNTSELIQHLEKGHKNVKLNDEAWDRLVTWIDLNVPYHGTWKEATGGKLSNDAIVKRFQNRKLYAFVTEDIEAVPNPYRRRTAFVKPRKPLGRKPPPVPKVSTWPFDERKAKAAQGANARQPLNIPGGGSITFVKIPAGSFIMGDAEGYPDEKPLSKVRLSRGFWMSEREVTNQQYALFDAEHDSGVYDMRWKDQTRRGYFVNQPDKPVIRVSWNRAMEFCKWLSKKTRKRVSLPTEAQWEWACRAGTDTPLSYGAVDANFSQFANLADVSMKKLVVQGIDPKPVRNPHALASYEPAIHSVDDRTLHLAAPAKYKPNRWGLLDMHGNVCEWTRSIYKPYPIKSTDGRDKTTDDMAERVVRGGSWSDRPKRARSAFRLKYPAWQRVYNVGIRLVIE